MISIRSALVAVSTLGVASSVPGPLAAPRAQALRGADCASPTVREQAYHPSYELPQGRQVVVAYIGASTCGPCRTKQLKAAIQQMKPMLACQAKATGRTLAVMGVSLDWQVDTAISYLAGTAPYDEIIAGNNWVNSAALAFIWQAPDVVPSIPQVVLLEREFDPEATTITLRHQRELGRFTNAAAIEQWVAKGALIPQ